MKSMQKDPIALGALIENKGDSAAVWEDVQNKWDEYLQFWHND